MRGNIAIVLGIAALAAALAPLALIRTGRGQNVRIERASVSSAGAQANGLSLGPAVSADGRYVAFGSDASNLTPGDTPTRDVFVHDRMTGATELVSVASDSTRGNGPSFFPALSGDGRYVVFQSDASNLVTGDTNDATDIFLHDRMTGTTTRVSVAGDGAQGNDDSLTPAISVNGRYVTFTSLASNLVVNDTNNDRDVFVRDLVAGTNELASVASDGTHGNFTSGGFGAGPARISNDGRYVVFGSFASNLVANDTNSFDDIFLRDRVAGTTERVSVATAGTEGNGHSMYGSVSDDGRFVAFFSDASNLVPGDSNGASDVFLRDRIKGVTDRLSVGPGGVQADGPSRFPIISADGGQTIAYQSDATNIVSDDTNDATDILVYHVVGYSTDRASVGDNGSEGNAGSTSPSLNSDGSVVAFQSSASNLVANDTNGAMDIFARGKSAAPAATLTPTPRPPTVTPTPTSSLNRIGDVNADHTVNAIDAAIILQYAAGLLSSPPGGSLGDVNHDGQTNAIDAALILQYAAGLLVQWPP
jgi:Tol biopolymer transport system component